MFSGVAAELDATLLIPAVVVICSSDASEKQESFLNPHMVAVRLGAATKAIISTKACLWCFVKIRLGGGGGYLQPATKSGMNVWKMNTAELIRFLCFESTHSSCKVLY